MNKRKKLSIAEAVHEQATNLYKAGAINKTTMREFDELCEVDRLSPKDIQGIRSQLHLSQAVFAKHMNVTTGVVSKWERGDLIPRGPALKLLTIVRHKGLSAITIP